VKINGKTPTIDGEAVGPRAMVPGKQCPPGAGNRKAALKFSSEKQLKALWPFHLSSQRPVAVLRCVAIESYWPVQIAQEARSLG